ncbi:MAG: ectoine/hydroxyectoine ABC transporter permease subunit EhuC [Thermacetogeniaceae bacterium]
MVPFLLKGVVVTIELTVMAAILAFIMAFIAGFARLSKFAIVRGITQIYVEIFRGTSLLVQLFWVYFVLPFFGIELSAMMTGVLVLGLNYGAYASEVIRSSILAIPKGQTEAGIALNMSPSLIMKRVILPQAMLIMLPPLGNYLIELIKSTALVSLITLHDLMFCGTMINNVTMRTIEVYSLVLIIYFLLAYPLTLAIRRLEKKLSAGRL